MTLRKILLAIGGIVMIVALVISYVVFLQKPEIDPAEVAVSETRMWQAYYTKDRTTLATELMSIQRNQFGISFYHAGHISRHLGQAAMAFIDTRSDYESKVLPDLVKAYTRIQKASGLDFDPQYAAEAELAWWVARRDPKRRAPHIVGWEIAGLYTELYGESNEAIEKAGLLRAQAGALRDQGGENADWERVEALLVESYTSLLEGIYL
jgi:hypothetical protein